MSSVSESHDAPVVSIVIPTYNDDPAHLAEAIASARRQTHPHVEIVVVDDGSSRDETLSFLDSLPSDVRLLRQENTGPAGARNAGVLAASGTYIIPLDADDWIDPQFASEALLTIAVPETVLAYAPWSVFGGETEGDIAGKPEFSLADLMYSGQCSQTAMVRRADWLDLGGQDTDRAVNEDYELWIRLMARGGTARRIPTAALHYRERPGSRSSTTELLVRPTWEAVVRNNPGRLGEMLIESQLVIDDLKARLKVRDAQLEAWARRTAPLRAAQRLGRRAAELLKPGR